MRLGLVLPTWSGGLDGRDPDGRALTRLALEAEAAGFDSVWVPDGLMLRVADLPGATVTDLRFVECWTLLGAIAAATERVAVGTLVAGNSYRSPTVMATMAQTVDELSGHRLTLGLGAGADERAHAAFGLDFTRRVGRLEEALPAIRSLLRGETVSLHGTYYSIDECRLRPPQSDREIPILLGGTGDRVLDISARLADAWNAPLGWLQSTPAALAPLLNRLDACCERHQRDPAAIQRSCGLGVRLDGAPLTAGGADVGAGAIVGDADTIGARLREFADMGLAEVQLYLAPLTPDAIRTIGRLSRAL